MTIESLVIEDRVLAQQVRIAGAHRAEHLAKVLRHSAQEAGLYEATIELAHATSAMRHLSDLLAGWFLGLSEVSRILPGESQAQLGLLDMRVEVLRELEVISTHLENFSKATRH